MKTIILSVLILQSVLFAQYEEIVDPKFSPLEDYYKLNYLNGKNDGKGNTGIAGNNDISSVYMNPATLELDMQYQVNMQYTLKTTQSISYKYPANLSYD